MKTNLQTAFIVALLCAFVPIFNRRMLFIVIGVQFLVFIINLGNSMSIDIASRWNKFELTLPVKRSGIVNAKYLSFSILILMGLTMALITTIVTLIIHPETIFMETIFAFGFGFSLSVMTIALSYPIMLKLGTEKNEIIILLSSCASFGIYILITYIVSEFNGGTIKYSENPVVAVVSVIVSLLLITFSYFISLAMYKRKEL